MAIARVRGSGERPALVLLSHLDVVEASAMGWSEDPFAGTIRGGYVIGRGALDAKGLAVVHLLALEALSRRATPLRRDVLMLAVPDEESGGGKGLGWILRERPALLEGVGARELTHSRPHFHCPCGRERVEQTVVLLGREELREIVRKRETLAVRCEFCGERYELEPNSVGALLPDS